jgi:hypothetical protein
MVGVQERDGPRLDGLLSILISSLGITVVDGLTFCDVVVGVDTVNDIESKAKIPLSSIL